MELDADVADLGEYELSAFDLEPDLWIREGIVAMPAFESGVPWLLTALDAPEEVLEGLVGPPECILEDLGVNHGEIGIVTLLPWQGDGLLGVADGPAFALPNVPALGEGIIVEDPAGVEGLLQCFILVPLWIDAVLEGLAHIYYSEPERYMAFPRAPGKCPAVFPSLKGRGFSRTRFINGVRADCRELPFRDGHFDVVQLCLKMQKV